MTEKEAEEVLKSCLPIYRNLHDKTRHNLNVEEIKSLNKFKVLWDTQLASEDQLIKKAGMDIYTFAYLGGVIYQLNLDDLQA